MWATLLQADIATLQQQLFALWLLQGRALNVFCVDTPVHQRQCTWKQPMTVYNIKHLAGHLYATLGHYQGLSTLHLTVCGACKLQTTNAQLQP